MAGQMNLAVLADDPPGFAVRMLVLK